MHEEPIAFSCKDSGADSGALAPTLRSMGHDGSHANAGGQIAVAFDSNQAGDTCLGMSISGAPPVRTKNQVSVLEGLAVRRLTPRECERLQAWPDDSTVKKEVLRLEGNEWIRSGNIVHQADGPRYKQLGNGVTSSVAEWLGKRIVRFTQNRVLTAC